MSDRPFSRPWVRAKGFSLFARLANSGRSRPDSGQIPKDIKRILVLAPVLRGDYMVATPLIAGLKEAYPGAQLGVLVKDAGRELAESDPNVDRVLLYESLPKWFASMREVWQYHPDVVVLPKGHPAFTESLLMVVSRAKYRVGLSHEHHDPLLTHSVAHDWEYEHRTEAYVRLLAPFGVDPTRVSRRLHIGMIPEAERWAERIYAANEGNPLFSLNLSASRESRRWTLEAWQNLLRELLEYRPGARFVALSAPDQRAECESLARDFEAVTTVPTRSLLEAVAIVARTDMLITVDTGIVQTAAARGVPMVVLYNGDHEVYLRFAPQSVPHRAILAPRGEPVSTIASTEVSHEVIHLLAELEKS
ncbi:glycosyltransferase family 9 protein [bacterium]|nr:glycosyltransferase family 9 protein [bacterium]